MIKLLHKWKKSEKCISKKNIALFPAYFKVTKKISKFSFRHENEMIQWVTLETHWAYRREMGAIPLSVTFFSLWHACVKPEMESDCQWNWHCCWVSLFVVVAANIQGGFLYEAIKKGKKHKNRTRLQYALFEYQQKSWVCKLALVRSKFRVQQREPTRVEASAQHLVMFLPRIAKNFPIREQKGIWKCLSLLYQTPPSRAFLESNFPPCVCVRSHWVNQCGFRGWGRPSSGVLA